MLTLGFVLLIAALVAGVFGVLAVGPAGPVGFGALLLLAAGAFAGHYLRDRRRRSRER